MKIFVLPPSATGHVNPISGMVKELCKHPGVECVFYGINEHQELIEKTGATFRPYSHRNLANFNAKKVSEEDKGSLLIDMINLMIDSSYTLLPQLIKDVSDEKPDLIICDGMFVPAKYLSNYLARNKTNVKFIEFLPNFVITREMLESVPGLYKTDLKFYMSMFFAFLKQMMLSWKFNLSIYNPFKTIFPDKNRLKIVAVFPELHPRIDDYDDSHKFVGQCANEEVRSHEMLDDPELNAMLELFPPKIKRVESINLDNLKLIYMSLGTVFNNSDHIFQLLINDIINFEKKPQRRFKSSQLRVVISAGGSLDSLNNKITRGELTVPSNIIIRQKMPQLEILKRAHLFITHCGMNSTSEAIKYSVPIVSIPIEGDQPLVARRVCDELSLGVRLDPVKLRAEDIGDAVDEVLANDTYQINMENFSKVSERYNGAVEAAKIITNFLK